MATWSAYTKWKLRQLSTGAGSVDFDTDSLKLMLLAPTYTPNVTATGHEFLSDVNSHQVTTGTSYTGPITASGLSVTASGTTVTFDMADIQVARDSTTGFNNARYCVLYKDTGTASTSPLILAGDFLSNQSNQNGLFEIQINAAGVFYM